ncbi:hypothetical protein GCM10007939_04380 [Amylibacter marinus]|uniref:Uncharacterized protein n=1 Tax=Amylibacter marinus TaxID=1475483 RepID=A0ABQ5VS38_9RHOB|nr:hypothetical protein [Amylibacter marinus]GLQ34155.1 hypothetical protein GCM10007939_04380 [Amylibacter marinus]
MMHEIALEIITTGNTHPPNRGPTVQGDKLVSGDAAICDACGQFYSWVVMRPATAVLGPARL